MTRTRRENRRKCYFSTQRIRHKGKRTKVEKRVNRGKNREKQGKNIAQKLKFSAKTAVLGKKIFICG